MGTIYKKVNTLNKNLALEKTFSLMEANTG